MGKGHGDSLQLMSSHCFFQHYNQTCTLLIIYLLYVPLSCFSHFKVVIEKLPN